MAQTYFADGSEYKQGVHNKMYRWDGFDWISSTKNKEEVIEQEKKFLRKNPCLTNEVYYAKILHLNTSAKYKT